MNNGFASAVTDALDGVSDPLTGRGLLASGRIDGLALDEAKGQVAFMIEAPADAAGRYQQVRSLAEAAVAAVPGVKKVTAVLTAHRGGEATVRVRKGEAPGPAGPPPAPPPAAVRQAEGVAGVKAVIAVASAKGGVGKSTVAVNLACAFARLGLRTGLLDADVYGPSAPTLLGLAQAKPEVGADKKLLPLEAFGLATMSIGYLVNIDAPMIWRGPMATSAVRQMLDDVAWDAGGRAIDILVLDMPPGTGDIQLTIAQRLPLAGAIIVSTPQEVALADVRRGIAMFDKTHTPILGVIENMAWFEPVPGGPRHAIFGEGGARRTAEAHGAPFLGELPIDMALRESADAGRPLVATAPDAPISQRFRAIAEAALANMAAAQRPPPVIRFA
jgi:ATP-binding protein involved in chromosome partitioning